MTHSTLRTRARRATAVAFAAAIVTPLVPGGDASATTIASSSAELRDGAAAALGRLDAYQAGGGSAALVDYILARNDVAETTALELGLDPAEMTAAWKRADLPKQEAALAALTQLGVPYRTNTSDPGRGFDCSGLTTFAWAHAGLTLERQSGSQINAARAIDRSEAEVGDLVYYPGHVSMYLGVDNAIVHSPYTGRDVEITFITDRRASSVRFGDPTA
jgi:cell wall-associated NlpC family hydrolase